VGRFFGLIGFLVLVVAVLAAAKYVLMPSVPSKIFEIRASDPVSPSKPTSANPVEDGLSALAHQNYKSAFEILQPFAMKGNAAAQFGLGFMYFEGRGVQQDYVEAANWFLRSAQQGYSSSYGYLGPMYSKGLGVIRDENEAAKWFRWDASEGSVVAQVNMVNRYMKGLGVPQDQILAYMWYLVSAPSITDNAVRAIASLMRNELTAALGSAQITEAQARAERCRTSNFKLCDIVIVETNLIDQVVGRWRTVPAFSETMLRRRVMLQQLTCGKMMWTEDEIQNKLSLLRFVAREDGDVFYTYARIGQRALSKVESSRSREVGGEEFVDCRSIATDILECTSNRREGKTIRMHFGNSSMYTQQKLEKADLGCDTKDDIWEDFTQLQKVGAQ